MLLDLLLPTFHRRDPTPKLGERQQQGWPHAQRQSWSDEGLKGSERQGRQPRSERRSEALAQDAQHRENPRRLTLILTMRFENLQRCASGEVVCWEDYLLVGCDGKKISHDLPFVSKAVVVSKLYGTPNNKDEVEKVARALYIEDGKLDTGSLKGDAREFLLKVKSDLLLLVKVEDGFIGRRGRRETFVVRQRTARDTEFGDPIGRRTAVTDVVQGDVDVVAVYPVFVDETIALCECKWRDSEASALSPPALRLDGVTLKVPTRKKSRVHNAVDLLDALATAQQLDCDKEVIQQRLAFLLEEENNKDQDYVDGLFPKLAELTLLGKVAAARETYETALTAIRRGLVVPVVKGGHLLADAAVAAVSAATAIRYGADDKEVAHSVARAAKTAALVNKHNFSKLVHDLGKAKFLTTVFGSFLPDENEEAACDLRLLATAADVAERVLQCGAPRASALQAARAALDGEQQPEVRLSTLPAKTRAHLAEPTMWDASNGTKAVRFSTTSRSSLSGSAVARAKKALDPQYAADVAKCLLNATPRKALAALSTKKKPPPSDGVTVVTVSRHIAVLSSN